jgi:hypothetical protein
MLCFMFPLTSSTPSWSLVRLPLSSTVEKRAILSAITGWNCAGFFWPDRKNSSLSSAAAAAAAADQRKGWRWW